jgi:hypothetical protein
VTRFFVLGAVWMLALGVVVVLFFRDWVPHTVPTTAECIALWNAPENADLREQVRDGGYPSAQIGGAFSESRYQGCFATFAGHIGEPWALYPAVRIPGTDRPLRWRLDVSERRWGEGTQPPPGEEPRANVDVEPDGSVSFPIHCERLTG